MAENKAAKAFLSEGFVRRGLEGKIAFRSTGMDNKVRNILFEMGQSRYGCKRVIGRMDNDEWVTLDFALMKMGDDKEIMMTVNEESFYRNCTHDAFDEAFHLTITEAHVISQIALGLSPKEIAGELSISTNTVRAHLRSIYSKTDVRSFSKLLCLILRLTR
jgi:DNA-binding CsgD family transcriptional regulator